ncbi:MAG: hypothetical protein HC896_03510 [Bacteroidales bacterium]|nr:hypothetical protein [Bacteroidales bacterium]
MGRICIHNDSYSCIRIKELNSFEHIEGLQACFMDSEIKFLKKKKINAKALIQVKKHFLLEQAHEFIFRDMEDENMHYISLPSQISWKMFEQITYAVKNNIENANYDAALASVYLKTPLDAVRIYSSNVTQDYLLQIREKYVNEISKMLVR